MSTSSTSVASLPKTPAATLITGACIYTANEANDIYPSGSVLVVGSEIQAIGTTVQVDSVFAGLDATLRSEARRIDGSGFMVLPGFVNPHYHEGSSSRARWSLASIDDRGDVPGAFAHGVDVPALSIFFDSRFPIIQRLRPDEALACARFALWTQLRSGTTTWGDVGSSNLPEALVAATQSIGMRGAVSSWTTDGYCSEDGPYVQTRPAEEPLARLEAVAELCAADDTGRVRFLPSSLYLVSEELGRGLASLSERYDAPFATHLCAGFREAATCQAAFGLSPVRYLDKLGLINDRLIAVHTAFADGDEEQMLVEAGAHICHSPAKYGSTGEATLSSKQIMKFRDSGLDVSVSTDGEPMPLGGIPEAMRAAWLSHNEIWGDDTRVLPSQALAMGTRMGARALRWDNEIGSLEVGKQADLVMIGTDDWRYTMVPRPLESFLKLGGSADIHTVMVGGCVLVEGAQSTNLDEGVLREEFVQATMSYAVRELGVSHDQLKAALQHRTTSRASGRV